MAIETILGMVFGGVARLAPAVLDYVDKKRERQHEVDMLKENRLSDQLRMDMHHKGLIIQGENAVDAKTLDAFTEAIKGQSKPSGVKWVDALSASVRPVLTYWWCMGLYSVAIGVQIYLVHKAGNPLIESFAMVWGPDEKAIVASMLNFWFMGRVLDMMAKRRG